MNKPNDGRQGVIGEEFTVKDTLSPKPKDTSDFIQDLKSGDEDAFCRLVTEYTGRLRDYVFQFLDRYEDAEEAVQEVFLYLWEHRRNLTCESMPQLFKYIYLAGKTQAIRIIREKQHLEKYREYLRNAPESYNESPDSQTEIQQIEQIVQQALERMPRIRAMAYQMKYNEGMSYREVAEQLEVTESTARSHISNAVKDIKSHFNTLNI